MTPDDMNRRLGRGINFGNALDTAREGEAGFRLLERYFDDVRYAGFDSVRLPVRWSAHADESWPYTIDSALFERVEWAIGNAQGRDLNLVINVHHYHELQDEQREHQARFVALWEQIAARYGDRSDRLYFELLNEPRNAMTANVWNELLPNALAAVRECNPDRVVIVGPVRMNDIGALPELELPGDDRLIVTIHYYAPFEFTHQGERHGTPGPINGWAPPGAMSPVGKPSGRTSPGRRHGHTYTAARCSSVSSARTKRPI